MSRRRALDCLPMHRHPLAFVLAVVSAVVVANYAVDTFAGAYPQWTWIRGLKQGVTGA